MQITNRPRPAGVEVGFCITLDAEGATYLVFSDIGEVVDLQDVERRLIRDAVRAVGAVSSLGCDGLSGDGLPDDGWLSDYCCRLDDHKVRDPLILTNYLITSYEGLVRANRGMLDRNLYLVHCVCASLTDRDCMIAQSRLIEAREKW